MQIMGKDNFRSHALLTSILAQNADSIRLNMKGTSKGCLIVVEGIDGTGKSTLAHALAQELSRECGEMVILTQEPTERFKDFQGLEDLLAIHPGHPSGYVDKPALTSLKFTLDHAIHLADVIVPALADDRIVICDRWTPFSSRAYQGPVASILTQSWDIEPDLSLLLVLNPKLAMERLQKRPEGQLPVFEKLEILQKAQSVYREMALIDPRHWHFFDGCLPTEVLMDRAVKVVMSTLTKKRGK